MLGSTLAAGVLALVAATGAAPAPGGPHDVATTTAVVVTSAPDGALRVTVSVAAARGGAAAAPTGTVAVLDDGAPVALLPLDGGTASLTTSALDPSVAHRLSARFAATATHAGSSSAPVEVAGPAPASGAAGAVALTIPAGLLSITSAAGQVVDLTPRGRTGRGPTTGLARVVVTDTRAGNLGFTVSATLVAGPGRRPDARSA
ncbi:Ig-like domain repeat protein, partial [Actinotalea sp.]|uniref:Ig-like domain repeat protein n=1 Tax=Actinotalea sp. TaxID=1872145 RepID=UPI002D0E2CA5